MLNLGVVGLGPTWETLYRPALARLERRARVKAVYDSVLDRAAQVAAEIDAEPVDSIRLLLRRSDVRAVLIVDPGWQNLWPLRFALEQQRAAFLAAAPAEIGEIRALRRQADDMGLVVMPELPLRCLPASIRLRELSATRLSAVERLEVESDCDDPQQDQSISLQLLDWCCDIVQSAPVRVEQLPAPQDQPSRTIRIEFRRQRADRSGPVIAHVKLCRLEPPESAATPITPPSMRCRAECVGGEAILEDAHRIRWQDADGAHAESLTSDRFATELTLDHFIRRVVGGLIPVPGLGDLSRAWELLEAAARSREQSAPIPVTIR